VEIEPLTPKNSIVMSLYKCYEAEVNQNFYIFTLTVMWLFFEIVSKMKFPLAISLIFAISFLSGLMPLLYRKINNLVPYLIPLASGLLIGTSLFQLLPECVEIIGKSAGIPMAIGFAVVYFPQKYIATDTHDIDPGILKRLGVIAFLGIAFHSLTDGIGVGAAESGGILSHVSLAIIAHKIPDSLALSLILIATGFSRGRMILYLLLFAMTTPLGALLTQITLSQHESAWAGYSMGFSAGNFLAIAFGDVLKKIDEKNPASKLIKITLLVGGCLVSLINFHSH
jgi:zinc transporter ZupT